MGIKLRFDSHEVVPFGKYKGQPIEVLAEDHNNFGEPGETLEQNAMRAEWLEPEFQTAFRSPLFWFGQAGVLFLLAFIFEVGVLHYTKPSRRRVETAAKSSLAVPPEVILIENITDHPQRFDSRFYVRILARHQIAISSLCDGRTLFSRFENIVLHKAKIMISVIWHWELSRQIDVVPRYNVGMTDKYSEIARVDRRSGATHIYEAKRNLYRFIKFEMANKGHFTNSNLWSVGENHLLMQERFLRVIGAPLHDADEYQGPREEQGNYRNRIIEAILRHREWRQYYAYLWGLVALGFCAAALLGINTKISVVWGICVLISATLLGELLLLVAYLVAPHASA